MKNYLALLAFAFVFSAGCDDEDVSAPDEECSNQTGTLITIRDASDWNSYPKEAPIASYKTIYDTFNNKSRFYLQITCREICTKVKPVIKASLSLAIEDPEVEFNVTAEETNNHQRSIVTRTGTEYKVEDIYTIKNPEATTATVTYTATCTFPSKGSRQADSTYFFLNLVKFDHSTVFKRAL